MRIRLLLAVALLGSPRIGAAQTTAVHAQVIGAWHHASLTPEGRSATEFRLVQPMLMAVTRLGGGVTGRVSVNLEGLTLRAGELAPGAWGEGFVDRRHPHTWLHEVVVEAVRAGRCGRAACRVGVFAGKGFVPFGSDDPASRPLLRYPVNHHLAQILERAVVGGQLAVGPVLVEGALFNGDEPESPGQWPRLSRFGDSWSVRLTVSPGGDVELSASRAEVASPEHRPGAGADQAKTHLGVAWSPVVAGGRLEILGEWARTSELSGFFRFGTILAEGQWRAGTLRVSYRFEGTDRPEEERLSAYRSARPHLENSLLGMTRWTTHSAGVGLTVPWSGPRVGTELVGEVSRGAVEKRGAGLFEVAERYGGDRFWDLRAGVRLTLGGRAHRMGRYGAAAH